MRKLRVDLDKTNIKTLAAQIGVLSEDVKLHMQLLTANRYYALNDRTIYMLLQGEVDMSATTGVTLGFGSMAASKTVSDAGAGELLDNETEVGTFVVDRNKTRQAGAFFKCLNIINVDLGTYGLSRNIDRNNYKHNCLRLALKAGGLSYIKLQHLILTLRYRTTHKHDITTV